MNYDDYEKIVVAGPSRGHFFRLVYYLSDDASVYLDYPDNLISEPERWARFSNRETPSSASPPQKSLKKKKGKLSRDLLNSPAEKQSLRADILATSTLIL